MLRMEMAKGFNLALAKVLQKKPTIDVHPNYLSGLVLDFWGFSTPRKLHPGFLVPLPPSGLSEGRGHADHVSHPRSHPPASWA